MKTFKKKYQHKNPMEKRGLITSVVLILGIAMFASSLYSDSITGMPVAGQPWGNEICNQIEVGCEETFEGGEGTREPKYRDALMTAMSKMFEKAKPAVDACREDIDEDAVQCALQGQAAGITCNTYTDTAEDEQPWMDPDNFKCTNSTGKGRVDIYNMHHLTYKDEKFVFHRSATPDDMIQDFSAKQGWICKFDGGKIKIEGSCEGGPIPRH